MCPSWRWNVVVPDRRRSAIIDIGSNSIRLVVYQGPERAPMQIFNEKLMVGLGSGLASTGAIDSKAFQRGLKALARFKQLTDAMELDRLRCVATAAVRDASNGAAFLDAAQAQGLNVELLSGEQEAEAAGFGIIAAHPEADGIGADLGGGSLELVRIRDDKIVRGHSFPLGVLRLPALRQRHGAQFRRAITKLLRDAGWPDADRELPLYLVGGSWRAIARYHMARTRDPLPVMSGHAIPLSAINGLARRLASADLDEVARLPGLASARVASLPDAAELLVALTRALKSREVRVSSSGLREGLLYRELPQNVRAQDPLLVAAASEGRRYARFAPHGEAIDRWIAPLFTADDARACRLRLAGCLLTDVAASANPDFRTDRAVEIALHGQWMGISPDDRLVLAQTLYSATGGAGRLFPRVASRELGVRLKRAIWWGLALRLAQRLSGGTAEPLAMTRLADTDGCIELSVRADHSDLIGEQVEKRLKQLATAIGVSYKILLS
jgi:exopolyphosphatase / guanosine-5'-triphosphate,3'-diphosphate pyrophosphatase